MGKFNEKEVSFLVDSGATRNFVDPITAKRIGLKLIEIQDFQVAAEDGEQIEGKYCAPRVKISIQGSILENDLLEVSIGVLQVILETIWLKSLSPSLWDFN